MESPTFLKDDTTLLFWAMPEALRAVLKVVKLAERALASIPAPPASDLLVLGDVYALAGRHERSGWALDLPLRRRQIEVVDRHPDLGRIHLIPALLAPVCYRAHSRAPTTPLGRHLQRPPNRNGNPEALRWMLGGVLEVYGGQVVVSTNDRNVRYGSKADETPTLNNVRYWG